jgi:hypothetical protein
MTPPTRIVGFEQDDQGEWVALLECGHRQHVRHRPPWQERAWVLTEEGRRGCFGTPLECRTCDEERSGSTGEGGDPACWADRVCPECGALGGHRPDCINGRSGQSP